MSYVNEVNEKLSGPCHRCTLDGLALFIFHCWQVSCLRVTGQVNEWDIILFFRLPIKRKKISLFISLPEIEEKCFHFLLTDTEILPSAATVSHLPFYTLAAILRDFVVT